MTDDRTNDGVTDATEATQAGGGTGYDPSEDPDSDPAMLNPRTGGQASDETGESGTGRDAETDQA